MDLAGARQRTILTAQLTFANVRSSKQIWRGDIVMSALTPKAEITPLELERPHSAARLHEEAFHPGAGRVWCRRAVGATGSMRRASISYADDLVKRKSASSGTCSAAGMTIAVNVAGATRDL